MKYQPRTNMFYGMPEPPMREGDTWVESETFCKDIGQFCRRGLVRHGKTNELIKVHCAIPDTFFSIPATTDKEHGYVTSREVNGKKEFVFIPHTDQGGITPAAWRKQYKKGCK